MGNGLLLSVASSLHPRLLALGLELPEDALTDIHGYSSSGETYGSPAFLEAQTYPNPGGYSQIHEIVCKSSYPQRQSSNLYLQNY